MLCGSSLIAAFLGREATAAGREAGVSALGTLFHARHKVVNGDVRPCFPPKAANALGDLTGDE